MTDAAYSTACSQRNESHTIFVTRIFYNAHDVILLRAIYKDRKNILKMNKKVGMLLTKQELIQVE